MKKNLDLRRKVADILEIPPEIALNACQITLTGLNSLHAQNHQGIIEYLPNCIIFKTSEGKIKVDGHNLALVALNQNSLQIDGQINNIDLANL